MKNRIFGRHISVFLITVGLIFGLVAVATPAQAATPAFQMPFPCGEVWRASTYGGHNAIDWNKYPEDNNGAVVASASGTASLVYENGLGGYMVVINHSDGWQTVYAHLQQNGRVSGPVLQGQIIGYVGSSGAASGPHLHWEQKLNGIRQATLYANGAAITPSAVANSSALAYTSNNCPAAPVSDTDADGTPDSSDLRPNLAGAVNNRGVPIPTSNLGGDFNGDSYQDVAIFYYYGAGQTKLMVYYGTGGGNFAWPSFVWDSGVGGWDLDRTKPVVADFTGDGKTDIAAFYDYGNDQVKVWLFAGTSSGAFASPVTKWDSGVGNNDWKRLMPVVGDFDGDGDQDIMAFYDYGNSLTKLFKWSNDGTGNLSWPSVVWDSGAGNWDWERAMPVVGDFTSDGKTDIAAFYDYGGERTKILLFSGTAGAIADPSAKWDSGAGNHDWNRTKPFAGDFNGDGKTDLTLLYNYSNSTSNFLTLLGDGTGALTWPAPAWSSGAGNWGWSATRGIVSDFDGNGVSDIVAFHNYGGGQVKLFEFNGSSTGTFSAPTQEWDSGAGNHEWSNFLVP